MSHFEFPDSSNKMLYLSNFSFQCLFFDLNFGKKNLSWRGEFTHPWLWACLPNFNVNDGSQKSEKPTFKFVT